MNKNATSIISKKLKHSSESELIANAFTIGQDRLFDSDPRFGIIVLCEIASRALSPEINDPGTAIDVIGTLVRLFLQYSEVPSIKSEAHCYVRYRTEDFNCIRNT